MNSLKDHINELKAAEAFSKQAIIFDELYDRDEIIQYKRQRVRQHVLKYLKPGNSILELNSGTGTDALFFASNGYYVHATDISTGMLEQLAYKIEHNNYQSRISYEQCSFTELHRLKNKGPYDCIFSNFGGLNCTAELNTVLGSFSSLLKKDGIATLVIIPKFCLWETLLFFKGKFRTAFRRFFSSTGRKAHIEGKYFTCWYYNPSQIIKLLKNEFEVLNLEGLCTIVPPSYIKEFGKKHPKLFDFLKRKEDKLADKWPWKNIGDYFIITLQQKA